MEPQVDQQYDPEATQNQRDVRADGAPAGIKTDVGFIRRHASAFLLLSMVAIFATAGLASPWEPRRKALSTIAPRDRFQSHEYTVPLVILSEGCSGSSFLSQFSRRLAHDHGVLVSEMLKPLDLAKEKRKAIYVDTSWLNWELRPEAWVPRTSEYFEHTYNPFHAEIEARAAKFNFTDADIDTEMVFETYRSLVTDREFYRRVQVGSSHSLTMFPKILTYQFTYGVKEGLKKLGAKYVLTYRESYLEKMVCDIKDCFNLKWHEDYGRSVFENSTISELCFQRRKHPDVKTFAQLNTTRFEEQLRYYMNISCRDAPTLKMSQTMIENQAQMDFDTIPKFSEELLTAFEYHQEGTLEFQKSLEAWKQLLRAWDIEPEEEIILDVMRSQGISTRTPSSPNRSIYNFNEVRLLFENLATERKSGNGDVCDWTWMVN